MPAGRERFITCMHACAPAWYVHHVSLEHIVNALYIPAYTRQHATAACTAYPKVHSAARSCFCLVWKSCQCSRPLGRRNWTLGLAIEIVAPQLPGGIPPRHPCSDCEEPLACVPDFSDVCWLAAICARKLLYCTKCFICRILYRSVQHCHHLLRISPTLWNLHFPLTDTPV